MAGGSLALLAGSGRRWLRRLAWLAYRNAPLPRAAKWRLKQMAVSRFGTWLRDPERLDTLADGEQSLLLVLLGHLREDLFYAGYTEFFKDYAPVFELFDRVVIGVHVAPFDARLAQRQSPKLEVINAVEVGQLKQRPTLVVAFNANLVQMAHALMPTLPRRIVYYCQEFEAGFHPLGPNYIVCERAVARTPNLVVSTHLLARFLVARGLVRDQNMFVTRPRIQPFAVQPARSRRLFFYYRPESHNQRNLSVLVEQCVRAFCARHTGYEIFLVGTVATERSYREQGTPVRILRKLPGPEYLALISSCDVVVSLIYSAHPGVVAFQAAASGVPTVTNVFDNRDAALLRAISSNIVAYDPVRDELVDAVEAALALPKGRPHFDEALYSGEAAPDSLLQFHRRLLAAPAAAEAQPAHA